MMSRIISLWFIIIVCTASLGSPIMAQEKSRPVVLLYKTEKTQDFDNSFITAATRAIKTYFRETQRVDVMIFDSESPTVARAVLDKKLSADSVTSYSTREQKIEVAKVLGFDYASCAAVAIDTPQDIGKKILKMKIWLVDVNAGPKEIWETASSAVYMDTDAMAINNTIQSVANKAVLEVTRQAFEKLPIVNSVDPTTGDESIAIGAAKPLEVKQLDASDYSSKAEASISAGNLAESIEEYSNAVNSDPFNGPLRIKLAEAYAQKKMYKEALDTLDRALAIGAEKALVDSARQKIEAMQTGQVAAVTKEPEQDISNNSSVHEPPSNTRQTTQPVRINKKNAASAAIAKIVEGDKLWDKGDPDEAAKSYMQAISLNPSDWRAHERLAVVDASMSLFGESRKVLEQLKTMQTNPSDATVARRYEMLRKIFDKSFAMLLNQYQSESDNFRAHKITREGYYSTIRGLSLRSEAMAQFLDALTVPAQKQPANLHRSLACGLFAQAASSMIDYLETNLAQSKNNAQTFVDQAKKELDEAGRLDQDRQEKAIVTKVQQSEEEETDQHDDSQPYDDALEEYLP
ncbi:tetratricopeptide repeat protein [bacterium]|nr:tetratricopeptide repeat protein [bacterium]